MSWKFNFKRFKFSLLYPSFISTFLDRQTNMKYVKPIRIFKALLLVFPCYALAIPKTWLAVPVIDPMGYIRNVMCEKENNFAIVEDDILVKEYGKFNPNREKAAILQKLGGGRWPQGLVPYTFDPDLPEITKKSILLAMKIWEMHTKIHFEKIEPEQTPTADYIIFTPDQDQRCSSYVGRQGGGQPVLLASRCSTMNIVHELGHTIGLWHEQSRLDRDAYVRIMWENINELYWYNFNQHITDGRDYDEYDYQSIMHYSAYAFSKNHLQTIVPIQRDVEIGQRQFLSSKDIAAANVMCQD